MAGNVITNTALTYSTVGIREQLSDVIYRISPEETPFMSNGGREGADNTYFEWQVDALDAVDTANAQVEGDDIQSFGAATQPTRIGNRQQISRKTLIIAETQERVKKAGRKSEMAYQLSKRSAELKRDMESIALSNQAAVTGNSTTARKTGSLLSFLTTNTDFNTSDGADPVTIITTARTDGTQRNYSETQLKTVLSAAWTAGGKPRIVMHGAANKQNASAFAGIAQIRKAVEGRKAATIVGAADVYVSDFGNVTFVANRFQRARDVLVLDPDMYAFAYLRPFKTVPLAKTGDAEKRMLIVEWGLKVHNEAAHGGIFDLTTTVN